MKKGNAPGDIRNKHGQLVVTTPLGSSKAPITGVPANAPTVENLSAAKLEGNTYTAIKQYIDAGDEAVLNAAGRVGTINGVRPDAGKNINIAGSGRVKVVPNQVGNSVIISVDDMSQGLGPVNFLTQPDGVQDTFILDNAGNDIKAVDLLVYYGARLMMPGVDYTFDEDLSAVTFTFVPSSEYPLRAWASDNEASDLGLRPVIPAYGIQNGTNRVFTFEGFELTASTIMIFLNGMLLLPDIDFIVHENTEAVEFLIAPLASANLRYFHLAPNAARLMLTTVTGVQDGTNRTFSFADARFSNASAMVWRNGQLLSYAQNDFVVDGVTKTITFANAPFADTAMQYYLLHVDNDLRTINGVGCDAVGNIAIKHGPGILITPDPIRNEIYITIDPDFIVNNVVANSFYIDDFVLSIDGQYEFPLTYKPIERSEIVDVNGILLHRNDYIIESYDDNGTTKWKLRLTVGPLLKASHTISVRYSH